MKTAILTLAAIFALLAAGCMYPAGGNGSAPVGPNVSQEMSRQAQDNADAKAKALSLTVRKQYIEDHPGLRPHIKAAILDERPVVGMTDEQVVAAFTLWRNFSVPTWQKYKDVGAVGTWRFQKRNESKWNSRADQWVLFGNPRGNGRVDDCDLQAIMINFLDNEVTEWNDPGEVLRKDSGKVPNR